MSLADPAAEFCRRGSPANLDASSATRTAPLSAAGAAVGKKLESLAGEFCSEDIPLPFPRRGVLSRPPSVCPDSEFTFDSQLAPLFWMAGRGGGPRSRVTCGRAVCDTGPSRLGLPWSGNKEFRAFAMAVRN